MSIHCGQQNKKRRNGKKMGRQDRRKTFKIKSQIYTEMSGEKGYMSTPFIP